MAVDRQDREFRLLNNQLSQLSETFENIDQEAFETWLEDNPATPLTRHCVASLNDMLNAEDEQNQYNAQQRGFVGLGLQPGQPAQRGQVGPAMARGGRGRGGEQPPPAPPPVPQLSQRQHRMNLWPGKVKRHIALDRYTKLDVQTAAEIFLAGDAEVLRIGHGQEFDNLPTALKYLRMTTGHAGSSGIVAVRNWLRMNQSRQWMDSVRSLFGWLLHAYLFEEWRVAHANGISIRNIPQNRLDQFLQHVKIRRVDNVADADVTFLNDIKQDVRRGYKVRYVVRRLGIGSLFFFGWLSENEIDRHLVLKTGEPLFQEVFTQLTRPGRLAEYREFQALGEHVIAWLFDQFHPGRQRREEQDDDADEEDGD